MKQFPLRIGVLLICMLLLNAGAAAQKRTVNPATGAVSWETSVDGVALLLTQILPDQVRAFYLNRGLPAEATEVYATACVYMTVLRNDSAPGVVHFRQADWSVVSGGASRPPLSLEVWFERFEVYELSKSATIAFRWAQFPAEHDYQPGGDWNQGMLTTGLPAGAEFDLVVRWDVAGRSYEGVLKNVQCAN
ncbi:MAG: hypothetical protein B6D74_17910 [gamma proteobacterium symbiont of Ctena orbiculata]|nr:MAG: hypothetical protein B6D74_17910 [gamma proteobacterium symbiont of Ctena orbiculata]